MPSALLHPQAKFDPIPPDLDLHALVDKTPNFDWVVRITTANIRRLGPAGFEKLVQLHVIKGGKPLVIEGWNAALPEELFNVKWLEKTYDKKQESVRDIGSQVDIPMTTGHYLRSMRQLTNQWSPTNFRDERRQRLYLKDIDCPVEWQDHLQKIIPSNVYYLNENVGEKPGADNRKNDIFGGAVEKIPAPAGDLMSSLPEEIRAQNLMCYIGHEGTYTPAHREMCASLGQNIMVEASKDEHGEKAGSSIWFMTETKDREVVREYFLSMLGHDIEIEKHFAQINAWKKANFPVYIVEQKAGDFILIPPLAPHQVWNRGTRTMKVAWNRTTVETLGMALHEALPKARFVCRDEQYRNKAIIYYTLEKYYKELMSLEEPPEVSWLGLGQDLMPDSAYKKELESDFRQLFGLFTEIMVSEMFGTKEKDVEFIEFDSNIACSYCRANIFNRFLTCKHCVRTLVNGDEDTYDICMECYAMGRSCFCVSNLQWCEQWNWADLVDRYDTWRSMIIKQDGFIDIEHSPPPLEIARQRAGKKAVAQICQEQLCKRPWNDINKAVEEEVVEESDEPEVDEEGRLKKKKKSTRKKKKGETRRCHVCCHCDNSYKVAVCTTPGCQRGYCYGVLWRAFDMLPQQVMENENWKCPKCLKICNCGACRRQGDGNPYIPKNTILGHDTRPVADDRSLENLIDFRMHNLNWLKVTGEEGRGKTTKRMKRLMEQADAEKAKDPLNDAHDAAESAAADSMAVGLDSQSHIPMESQPEGDGPFGSDQVGNSPVQIGAHEPSSQVQMADMSGLQDPDESAYPDPSFGDTPDLAGSRMMGMGYYEQDDSADRILFDPYQMPSAEELREPEIAEIVRKTLGLAKRKARLHEDDDPEWRANWRLKKKPKAGNIDQLVNLDPALLGSLNQHASAPIQDTVGQSSGQDETSQPGNAGTLQQDAPRPKNTVQPGGILFGLPVELLNPTLRHAKPKASYAEPEEVVEEDLDEMVPNFYANANARQERQQNRDPVDLAAEAIRALTGTPARDQETSTADNGGTPQRLVRKRGRPPKNSLGTDSGPSSVRGSGKKRGRPPGRPGRPRLSGLGNTDTGVKEKGDQVSMMDGAADEKADAEENGNDDFDLDVTIDELEAQLARELEEAAAAGAAPVDSTEKDNTVTPPAPKRGRSPKEQTAAPPALQVQLSAPPTDKRFMSMADRMALKGKKVKVRERRSVSASDTPNSASGSGIPARAAADGTAEEDVINERPKNGRKELKDDDFRPPGDQPESPSSSSQSSAKLDEEPSPEPLARGRPARKSTGPTIVRLDLDSGSDGSSSTAAESNSEFGSDSDDIPAKKPAYAVRGRGRGRGRPAGRARAGLLGRRGRG